MTSAMRAGGGASPWPLLRSGPQSKTTWLKVEKGDPGVLAGTYVKMLFVLGLVEKIAQLADPANDSVGLRLEEERLPRRIRHKKGKPSVGL
jgi:hypothetical protein